jgi:hypothetical protein
MKQKRLPALAGADRAIIGLTVIRGLAGFISQYGLTWAARPAPPRRCGRAMFQRVLDAEPLLFTRTHTASNLVNTLTFEVQAGGHAARPTRSRAWSATRSASLLCSATWSGSTGS